MATLHRLNALFVKNAKDPGWHSDGGGLYLRLTAKGAKQWIYVFQWQGVRKEMGLGGADVVKLTQAREFAESARKQVKSGVNPIEARRMLAEPVPVADRPVTFGEMADTVIVTVQEQYTQSLRRRRPAPFTAVDEQQEKRKLHKHLNPWRLSLITYCQPIRDRPVAEVDTNDVLSVLKPIWAKVPESADRTRSRIEAVCDAAAAKGLRSRENPARWRNHLEHLLPKRPQLVRGHHPAMPYANLPDFMLALHHKEAFSARALQFTILTCVRTTEALGAEWGEFQDDDTLWIVPSNRMKAVGGQPKEHRVPLSPAVTQLIKGLKKNATDECYVFPGAKRGWPLSEAAMMKLVKDMGYGDITVHGFRSTFRDWAGDETGFDDTIVEMCLAHAVGNAVRRAYRRKDGLDRRREVMEAWARYAMPKIDGSDHG